MKINHIELTLYLYTILLFGTVFSLGFYSYQNIIILFFAFITFSYLVFLKIKSDIYVSLKDTNFILNIVLIISIFINILLPNSLYETNNSLKTFNNYLQILPLIPAFLLIFQKSKRMFEIYCLSIFVLSLLSLLLVLTNSPNPKIDVFTILNEGSNQALNLKNPYSTTYSQIYKDKRPDYFTYPPVAFISVIPAKVIFKDVRITFLIAEIATALILVNILRKKNYKIAYLIPLVFLNYPLNSFILEQSWMEPLIVLFLLLFGVYLQKQKKLFSFIAVYFAVGLKQNMVFAIIFLLAFLKKDLKILIISALPVAILTLTYFMLGPNDFIKDTLIEPFTRTIRPDALSINSFFYNLKEPLIAIFLQVIPIIITILLLTKRKLRSIADFYLVFSYWFFCSVFFYKEAFLNHYFFVNSLLLIFLCFFIKEHDFKI